MKSAIQSVLERRSVRSFTKQQIKDEDLDLILQAAVHAPSGRNQQPWHFTALQNPQKLKELDQLVVGDKDSFFYNAPTLILVSIEIGNAYEKEDTACALTNMMQASHALGLGSVWCNRINSNHAIDTKLTSFGVPEGYRVTGTLAVGYPNESAPSPKVLRENTITYVR